jgi:hypothetical protein
MPGHEWWQYLHILVLVFWVGTDMGVMLCARKSTDSRLSLEARLTLLRMALLIELLPRTMWALALPTGVMLSRQLGLLAMPDAGVALLWLFTAVWAAISLAGARWSDQPIGQRLSRVNRWIIGILGTALLVLGVASYAGHGPFESAWLSVKVTLYGLINLTILGIEIAFLPLGPAFGRLAVEGSKPETEALISSRMGGTLLWVYTTYILILIVALIGVAKPTAITAAYVAYFIGIAAAASALFAGLGRMLRST